MTNESQYSPDLKTNVWSTPGDDDMMISVIRTSSGTQHWLPVKNPTEALQVCDDIRNQILNTVAIEDISNELGIQDESIYDLDKGYALLCEEQQTSIRMKKTFEHKNTVSYKTCSPNNQILQSSSDRSSTIKINKTELGNAPSEYIYVRISNSAPMV